MQEAQTETYNGWKNHATWCVNLHLSNDEPLYREALARTEEAVTYANDNADAHPNWTHAEGQRYSVADMLKDWVEEMFEAHFDGPYQYPVRRDDHHDEPRLLIQDLVGGYLSDVDWYEIADSWIEQVSAEEDSD